VQRVDAERLANFGHVLSGQHGSVWRGLVSVSFDFHTTSDTGDGFFSGQVSDVHEGVVEAGVNVGDAEDVVAGADLRAQLNVLFLFFNLTSFWCHF